MTTATMSQPAPARMPAGGSTGRWWGQRTAAEALTRLNLVVLLASRVLGLLAIVIALAFARQIGVFGAQSAIALLVEALGAWNVVLLALCWARGRIPLGLVAADVWVTAMALVGNALLNVPGYVYPYGIAAMVLVGLALRPWWAMLTGALVATVGYLASALLVTRLALASTLPHAAGFLLVAPVVWAVTGVFEWGARALDAGRSQTAKRASELAAARMRVAQARRMHDRVVQTMEILAHGDWLHDPTVRNQIAAEAVQLRALMEQPDAGGPDDLVTALQEVVVRQTAAGLRVDLHTVGLGPAADPRRALPGGVLAALTGAVTEALTNVGQHAGVHTARVQASGDERGVRVSVADNGVGFDPTDIGRGAGIADAIRARIEQAGGEVYIDSTPGAGTFVETWVPLPVS